MTITTVESKKEKQTPLQKKANSRQGISSELSQVSPIPSMRAPVMRETRREILNDWDHAS